MPKGSGKFFGNRDGSGEVLNFFADDVSAVEAVSEDCVRLVFTDGRTREFNGWNVEEVRRFLKE